MSVLVACIGNIFEGDDGFGCEVARVMAGRVSKPGVQVIDFGIRSLHLTYALLESPELTIFVDAVSRGGDPGTLYVIEPDLNDLGDSSGTQFLDAHGMNPMQVLRMAKSMGAVFGRILLVGCEPAHLGGEEGFLGLTEPVSIAVEQAAELVFSLIDKEMVEV